MGLPPTDEKPWCKSLGSNQPGGDRVVDETMQGIPGE
jgi:hypothetical protein